MAKPSTPRPIASKVLRSLDRVLAQKVIDFSAIKDGREIAEKLQAMAPGRKELDDLHPAHAAYVSTMNQIGILAESLTQLPELDRISDLVGRFEDEYQPSGPPMSPLTNSYFSAWLLFDCGIGIERETVGTILLDLRKRIGMHEAVAGVLEKLQASRMGLFELEATTGKTVQLRELVTEARVEAINPTGYAGTIGTVWYVRALPPPVAEFPQHIILTTPYEIVAPRVAGWVAFLDRTLPKTKITERKRAYEHLMKWGLATNYWHEYVFEAYANHQTEAIRLMGLPDVPESRPHSRMNEDEDGPLRNWLLSERVATGATA